MRNIVLLIALLFGLNSSVVYGQNLKPRQERKLVKKGRKAYRKAEYWKAKSYYDKVTNSKSTNDQYWYEAGAVYYDSNVEVEKSLQKFEKALELSTSDTIPEILMYLGHANHFVGNYEEAIKYYNLFKPYIKDNDRGKLLRADIDSKIEVCNNAIVVENQKPTREVVVNNMGNKVNSTSADYAPVVTNDENLILFCSRRPPGKKRDLDGQFYEDILFTTRTDSVWNDSKVIDKNSGYVADQINNGKTHEAPISLSPDGNTLFIYKENSVWKSEKDDKGQWTLPVRMNQNINIGMHNPSVFITPDGKEMFIVSQGAIGSLGGRDIYHTTLQEDGTWAEPQNLGPNINTMYNEDAPYITKDGNTLYFASDGHNTMGGYDIYKSEKDENGNWGKPMNVGAPINSPGNDIYYMENDEGTIAYFASQRPGSFGYLDIYHASFECLNLPTTDIKGYAIYANNHMPIEGVIKITNKTTGEEMGSYTVDQNGKYQMVLPPNETYLLEFVIADNKYTNVRPHQEEFFIPKQCEAYNLFQQIAVNKLKDENGQNYAQKAHFKNAMFDIESEIEKEYGSRPQVNTTYLDSTSSITGTLAYNKIVKAKDVTITLLNENHEILRITKTDDNGDFAFEHIDNSKPYIIMINEDDAKRNYFGDNPSNNSSEISLQGFVYNINNQTKTPSQNTAVYLANTNKIVSNTTRTDNMGYFEFTNNPDNPVEVATVNQKPITYNLNIPIEEVVFSAYVTNIDPDNTELAYTEYIDIIELKDMDPSEMPEFANIYFDFDKYFLRERGKNILESLSEYMIDHPNVTVRLDGHTDWFGTEEYNVPLSENRTLSAYKYLIDKGISQDRIINKWFGETQPAVANANPDGTDNPENRQLNRRVEIKVDIPDMASIYIQL